MRERVIEQLQRWCGLSDFLGLAWVLRVSVAELEPVVRELEDDGVLTWRRGLVRLVDQEDRP